MNGSAAVAVRRTTYPQANPRAADLMQRGLALAPPLLPVSLASRRAERQRARHVAARIGTTWGVASRETLSRALALGLGRAPLATVLWDAALVSPSMSEVTVRRQLGPDRPFALVAGPHGPVGIVLREPGAPGGLPLSVHLQLDQLPGRVGEVLRTAGRQGDALGLPVAVVGGLVRDLLLGRVDERTDLDLVVEGSGVALAHQLAASLDGHVVEHRAFLTATVVLRDGRRIDIATARRESYRAPGALPVVEPVSLAEDLARRDFSVNALAVRLDRAAWGRVLDSTGGLVDLRTGRIRVLHPLSLVEDPTRILRAARFAARLGCRVDRTTRRLAAHAATLGVYRALSGDRLRGELELMLAERRPAAALRLAGELGAWGLVVPEASRGRRTAAPPHCRACAPIPRRARPRDTRRPRSPCPVRGDPAARSVDGPLRPRPGRARGDPARPRGGPGPRRRPLPGSRPGERIRETAGCARGHRGLGPRAREPPGPPASRPPSAELAASPAPRDGRRRRRSRRSARTCRRRTPERAPRQAGRRTDPQPRRCDTLVDGRHRPRSRGPEGTTHPTG